jgi:hypothetical protein
MTLSSSRVRRCSRRVTSELAATNRAEPTNVPVCAQDFRSGVRLATTAGPRPLFQDGGLLKIDSTLQAKDIQCSREMRTMADQTRVTDDSVQVRQLSHYQFSFRTGDRDNDGMWTLQLVLDEGAWEEIITVTAEDADVLQELLAAHKTVFYDIKRRLFMFGVKKPGH